MLTSKQKKQEAWKLFHQANTSEAARIIEEVCQSVNADAEAMYLLGSCCAKTGDYVKAIRFFEKSLEFQPDLPYSHVGIGAALNLMGNKQEAKRSFQKAITLNPATGEAHMGLAEILNTEGDRTLAQDHYRQACTYLPDSGVPHYKLGLLARYAGKPGENILPYFTNAVNREPHVPQFQTALGECLLKLGRFKEARSAFSNALNNKPRDPTALGGMATVCVKDGEYTEAEKYIDQILETRNYTAEATAAFLLVCKHLNRCNEAMDYAQRCLTNVALSDSAIKNIHMQLAAVLDYLGLFDEAWQHATIGNSTNTSPTSYNPVSHKKFIDNLINTFTPNAFISLPRARVKSGPRPLFIIGMPRSGTSLVEQILSAHPDISGGGELTEISNIIKDIPNSIETDRNWPDCIHDIKTEDIDRYASRYLNRLQQISGTSRFVTDKMPHNFYAIGLIELLFPDAKIIHCRRQALDTCLSIYFQNFLVGHEYASTLFHIGTHHHQYQRLMQHWRANLPDKMMEVEYEALVESPESVMTAIFEYCGLAWHDDCLQFHTLNRQVDTASFDQVRQPLHQRSVEHWRHYEEYLDELKDGLECGY